MTPYLRIDSSHACTTLSFVFLHGLGVNFVATIGFLFDLLLLYSIVSVSSAINFANNEHERDEDEPNDHIPVAAIHNETSSDDHAECDMEQNMANL